MEDMRECMAFEEEDWSEDNTELTMLWIVLDDWISKMYGSLPYWIWWIRGWLRNKHVQIQLWWKLRQCAKWERKHGNHNPRS